MSGENQGVPSGFRVISEEEIEQLFEAYRTARIYPNTGEPSIEDVAKKTKVSPKTLRRLRDENDWEPRRLRILEQVKKKADAKRVRKDVSKVKVYENIEKAGLNFQTYKIFIKKGQAMSDLKITDIIAVGKHVEHLKGDDRSDGRNDDRPPINVIFQLPENGMMRKNGTGSSSDSNND